MSNVDFYTSIERYGNQILYRGYKNGLPVDSEIKYEPHVFIPSQTKTEWVAYSDRNQFLTKKYFGSINDFNDYVERYKDVSNFKTYGCSKIIRQYTAEYFKGEINWDFNLAKVWYLDIETKAESGFPDPANADQDMLLVTMWEKTENIMHVWSRRPVSDDCKIFKEFKVDFRLFEDEKDFLNDFSRFVATTRIDVLTGWNSESFDIPYIINRIKNVLGDVFVKLISPWKVVKPRIVKDMNFNSFTTYDIYGVTHLDALLLYKKFNPGSKESFSLDNIAFEELGKRKVDIPVETFKESYAPEYWDDFVYYCAIDTHLVFEIDQKMDHTKLAMQLGFMAKCSFNDVLSAMRLWESIIYNHFNDEGVVEDFNKPVNAKEQIVGAYVHEPKAGKTGWTVSIDAEALYPSMMMQHNISPDVFLRMVDCSIEGILDGKFPTDFDPSTEVLSANGVVTSKSKEGFIPLLAKKMGVLRRVAKNEMLRLKQVEQDMLNSGKSPDDADVVAVRNAYAALDVKQKGLKTAANSFYGCVGLSHFRYYDYRFAEAITSNGQVMLKTGMKSIDLIMNRLCKTSGVCYVIYSDTDSCYIDFDRFVSMYCKGKSDQEIVTFIEKFTFDVLQPEVDKFFKELLGKMGSENKKIYFKLECIGPSILFIAKKRYAFDILYSEGVRYEKPKMKVMGLEIVRSSTPSKVKDHLKKSLELILRSDEASLQRYVVEVKKTFMELEYTDISFPRGCNGLKVYASSSSIYEKRTPIHVRGALLFNHHLKRLGLDNRYNLIQDGEKIKFIALTMPNPIHENVISYVGKLPPELGLNRYFDKNAQYEKAFLGPLEGLLEPIGWDYEERLTVDSFFD